MSGDGTEQTLETRQHFTEPFFLFKQRRIEKASGNEIEIRMRKNSGVKEDFLYFLLRIILVGISLHEIQERIDPCDFYRISSDVPSFITDFDNLCFPSLFLGWFSQKVYQFC